MQKLKILIFLLFVNLYSQGQPYLDIMSFQVGNYPISSVFKGGDQWHVSNNYYNAGIKIPKRINEKNLLLFSPEWINREYASISKLKNYNFVINDIINISRKHKYNESFTSIIFPLTWVFTFNDTTNKIIGSGIYRFNYEKKLGLNTTSAQLGCALMYAKTFSRKFSCSAGLYYNREAFGNLFLPLIGFEWNPNNRIFCWGILPRAATIDYQITPPIHVGFGFKGIQESYYQEAKNNYFSFTQGEIRLFADYYLNKTPFVLTLEIGNTVARSYIYYAEPNGVGNKNKFNPTESMFARGGIAYRYITNRKFKTKQIPFH